MSESPPLIYSKISAIMTEMDAVPKGNTMEQGQKYRYRSIDQIKNASNPLFAKHRVFYSPKVLEKEVKDVTSKSGSKAFHYTIKVLYCLFAEDGSKVECEVYGEAMDYSDKGLGKAQTYAEKVMLIQVLNIPTEDQEDPDHDKPDLGDGKKPTPPLQLTATKVESGAKKFCPEPQVQLLYKTGTDLGWKEAELDTLLKQKGFASRLEIPTTEFNNLLKEVKAPK